MNKTTSYTIAVLIAAVLFWGVLSTPKVDADKSPASAQKRNTWEYCSVVVERGRLENMGRVTALATIHYARTTGTVVEKVEQTGADNVKLDSDLLGKAMAKLGEEGWEMVAQGIMPQTIGSDQRRIYFKRRVSN